jgi:SWI/SNF-related matrix-associated actin-dependent regulator 1 of chromatin subfamily A
MILDYVPSTQAFTLRVLRGEADPRTIMKETGFDFSASASRGGNAILFTRNKYAAAVFAEHATPYAYAELGWIINEVKESWKDNCDAIFRCPADKELWPFQRADLSYALRRKNTLVGDQPGLGKTPTAICFANEIRAKRVLVICPANIRRQWANRIREWSTMRWPYIVYPVLNSGRGVHPEAEWTVVSYDLARTPAIGAALARGKYDLLIIDEAHYAKSIDAARTHALFGDHTGTMREAIRDDIGEIIGYNVLFEALAGRSERVLALTGTPLPNRPREAYTLARNLCFDAIDWMSEASFKDRFNPSARMEGKRKDGTTYIYNKEEAGRHGELNNRLRSHFMCRHLKRDVAPQLKLPIYDIVLVDETAAVRQALAAESLLHLDPDDENVFSNAMAEIPGDVARVRHMMGVAKAPFVAEYVKMILDGGEDKVFVFGWHIEVLDILQHALQKFGVIRIDGRTGEKRKEELKNEFIKNPNIRIALGNIQSIGTGTDGLQEVCSRAISAEASWVPGENEQAVERLDRLGQKGQVLADFLVAPGSIDERILSGAIRKKTNTHRVLDNKPAWLL